MDPVTTHVNIDRPREEVFAYLADIANNAVFTDHLLKYWRLTREESEGRGAWARYRQTGRFDRFGHYDMSFAEVEAPRRLIAVGRGGKYNRIKTYHQWTLEPDHGGTRLEYLYESEPALTSDRIVEAISRRKSWFRRNSGKGLKRLRRILEEDRGRGARATVGGLDLPATR